MKKISLFIHLTTIEKLMNDLRTINLCIEAYTFINEKLHHDHQIISVLILWWTIKDCICVLSVLDLLSFYYVFIIKHFIWIEFSFFLFILLYTINVFIYFVFEETDKKNIVSTKHSTFQVIKKRLSVHYFYILF